MPRRRRRGSVRFPHLRRRPLMERGGYPVFFSSHVRVCACVCVFAGKSRARCTVCVCGCSLCVSSPLLSLVPSPPLRSHSLPVCGGRVALPSSWNPQSCLSRTHTHTISPACAPVATYRPPSAPLDSPTLPPPSAATGPALGEGRHGGRRVLVIAAVVVVLRFGVPADLCRHLCLLDVVQVLFAQGSMHFLCSARLLASS